MYGLIYCATNTVNGKQYVGQTTLTLARRWQGHLKAALKEFSASALHCTIRKYGTKAFKVEQIDFAESLEELNGKEAYYILQLKTLVPDGYNLTSGGEGCKVSEETRKKLSELAGNCSEVTRRKISEAKRKLHCKQGHPFDEVNTYIDSRNHQLCLTCHYIRHWYKLPQKLEKYVGKEIAHV